MMGMVMVLMAAVTYMCIQIVFFPFPFLIFFVSSKEGVFSPRERGCCRSGAVCSRRNGGRKMGVQMGEGVIVGWWQREILGKECVGVHCQE